MEEIGGWCINSGLGVMLRSRLLLNPFQNNSLSGTNPGAPLPLNRPHWLASRNGNDSHVLQQFVAQFPSTV